MSRLAIISSLTLLASPQLTAQQSKEIPPLPERVHVRAEVAATHIVKKAEPAYPAFAKAAGMQGVVRVQVVVGPDGQINGVEEVISGWACLRHAARNAAAQFVFRPFEKNGHPVIADTSVDVVFGLPGTKKAFDPPPPPPISKMSNDFKGPYPSADLSPELGTCGNDRPNRTDVHVCR